ncbi:MAG: NAD-glutamate dehydrogenase, partial [Actinomycetota bacterium]|nr:NAD-glutamate dehydrogenase [Actinomycetota bacterium]
MAVKAGGPGLGMIEALEGCVRERLAGQPPATYEEFARQYYQWVPEQDLRDRNPLDLCGSVVAHWRRASQRAPGEAKVGVYNPDMEGDGWHSPYTVVEVVSDDMPFLVDSVTMELSRQGYAIELIIHPVMRVVRDADGVLVEVLEHGSDAPGATSESVIHAEVRRQSDSDRLAVLQAGVELVLEEARVAVVDWALMQAKTAALAAELDTPVPGVDAQEASESRAFLRWLSQDHFT